MNHYVPSWRNLLSVQSYDFADSPANAVAFYRAPQRFLDAPSEPAFIEAIGAKKNGKFSARPAAAFAIHRVILRPAHQASSAGKIMPRRIRRA
jgi:hypothetical protein